MRTTSARLRMTDSVKFENMYSEKDGIRYEDMGRKEDMSWSQIEPYLDKLPPREQDLITLYRKHRKNQKDIAKMFSITQGAVSSRLKRALSRLEYIRNMPKISKEEIDRTLSEVFDPLEIEIIKQMNETTCQSRTATLINEQFGYGPEDKRRMTQVKVRHRFEKCLNQLKLLQDESAGFCKFYKMLEMIKGNLYMLHEVKLPHFDRAKFALFSLNG